VTTIRNEPQKLKFSPGKMKTLCSFASVCMNLKQVGSLGKCFDSINVIMYIAPFGITGTNPGTSFSKL
jgi:hypothetical protein